MMHDMQSNLLDNDIVDELIVTRRFHDGARVKARRTALQMTLAQVGGLSGLSPSVISRAESGTFTPRDGHKVRISAALGCQVNDLWKPLDILEVRERATNTESAA